MNTMFKHDGASARCWNRSAAIPVHDAYGFARVPAPLRAPTLPAAERVLERRQREEVHRVEFAGFLCDANGAVGHRFAFEPFGPAATTIFGGRRQAGEVM